MNDIHFIITGGTLDKIYNPITEKPEPSQTSVIPEYLETTIKLHRGVTYDALFMLDSLDIQEKHRKIILEAVEAAPAKKVLITHGTSTLENTAQYLQEHLKPGQDKTIILVGAMIPMKEFPMSDAGFNLGFAIGAADALSSGVYICMNAHVFTPEEVTKNVEIGRFIIQK